MIIHSKIVFLFIILLQFTSCDIVNKAKTDEQNWTYSLDVNGCQTGSHSFGSIEAYCDGLEDNALNNNCAQSARASLFASNCPGVFSPAFIEIKISK